MKLRRQFFGSSDGRKLFDGKRQFVAIFLFRKKMGRSKKRFVSPILQKFFVFTDILVICSENDMNVKHVLQISKLEIKHPKTRLEDEFKLNQQSGFQSEFELKSKEDHGSETYIASDLLVLVDFEDTISECKFRAINGQGPGWARKSDST